MQLLTLVVVPVVNALEIKDTSVVVVLSGEDNGVQIARVCVRDRVAVGVPSTET